MFFPIRIFATEPTGQVLAIIAGICFLAVGDFAEAREWTNNYGRTFEADFVKMDGTKVVFSMADGRQFSTPILELIASDQMLIRQGATKPIEDLRSNLGRPWPREVRLTGSAGCKVISEDTKSGRFIYESQGYRFYCDARITHDALGNFATLFESTRAYLAALPISLMSGETLGSRSRILLFGEMENYFRSGGPPHSAGCFISGKRLVLIPMDSLGLKRGGTGFSRDLNRNDRVLIHELVHQLTPGAYYAHGSLGWFSEGLAEYVAATPYNMGYFKPDIHGNSVRKYVTAHGEDGTNGRNLGVNILAPKLRALLLMDYRQFSGENGNLNYGLGLLLTHYMFHMEGDGKARRITLFLKNLQQGVHGEAALAPLLGGGSYEKLEAEIAAAWAKKGINIRFGG